MNTGSTSENRGLAPEILTVGQLNRMIAGLLQRSIAPLWVGGELSNVTRAASGHWYFTLKDASAQVRAVMFRGRAQYVDFVPRDGDRVEVRASVTLYEPRGDYQLAVESMRRAGAGDLYQRYLRLKAQLQAQGLFDAQRKRPLPALPRTIGVVTSPAAAALRDVLTTLRRRAPAVAVIVYPTLVQGADAPAAIVAALAAAARRRECEVLLLVRGGGSIEDLWAFNDEAVARAVAASPIPVVSGVGHETDFTIADFAADQRAPTPTAAAALAVPDRRELLRAADVLGARLARAWARRIESLEQRLDTGARLLRSPAVQWQQRSLRLQALAQRAIAAGRHSLVQRTMHVDRLRAGLHRPRGEVAQHRLDGAAQGLQRAAQALLARRDERLGRLAASLALVSPRAVLARGYAIVQDRAGRVLRASIDTVAGDPLSVTLARGALRVEVREAIDDGNDGHDGNDARPGAARRV
ncbi:MAG: exodeoxyribonuclease VII large subunit [Burkholderiaceae bacterium]|nr:exodeoxyribonuclease VII large subunit [Burkholderiaceae bacterium]MEB2350142.1 exodeoxyribonuclease VII large subunit [Burkholderiaceae bacterium]